MAQKAKVKLILGDGSTMTLDLPENDPQGAFQRLLKGKGDTLPAGSQPGAATTSISPPT
jgi:hypothetical protein